MIARTVATVGGLSAPLRTLFFATLIFRFGAMAFPFLSAWLLQQGQFGAGTIGLVVGAFGAGAVAADALAGPLLARFRPSAVMTAALAGNAAITLLIVQADGVAAFIALTFAWGFTYEAFAPACFKETYANSSAEERKVAFSCNRLAINLGMAAGPALGSVVFFWRPDALFYLNASVVALAGLYYALSTRRALAPAFAEAAGGEGVAGAEVERSAAAESAADAVADPRRAERRLWVMFCLALPVHIGYALPTTFLAAYVITVLEMPSWWVGAILGLNALCIVLFEVPVNKAMSHMTHATSISIGIACAAAGFLLMDSWPVGAVLILATLLWSAGEMIIFPSLLHYTSDISEPRRIGRNMGVYASGVTLGLMVTPSLALMLMEAEALPSIWHVVGVVLAATALGLPLLRRVPALWLDR